jgi:hypothetical protein
LFFFIHLSLTRAPTASFSIATITVIDRSNKHTLLQTSSSSSLTMASSAFLQMTRKRPWVSLGAAATGISTASAFGLEAHANRQEQFVVSSLHHGKTTTTTTTTTAQVEEALAASGAGLPRTYDRQKIRQYWLHRPVSVVKRLGEIVMELGPVGAQYYLQETIFPSATAATATATNSLEEQQQQQQQQQQGRLQYHAEQLREALTNLGPAWVKGAFIPMYCFRRIEACLLQKIKIVYLLFDVSFHLIISSHQTGGQQLAIRPDLVSPVVLKELQKLCDSVRPVPDEIALQLLREELEIDDLSKVFGNLHLVASASLGQVYQAQLLLPPPPATAVPNNSKHDGQKIGHHYPLVAIKVQRPGMRKAFSLDLFLLQQWGDFMDGFTSIFTQQLPYHRAFFDAFAHGSYSVRNIMLQTATL